jgi:diguanylate cyclase (GGDEF)-like protein
MAAKATDESERDSPFLPHGVAFLVTLGACVAAAELRPFEGSNTAPVLLLAVVISAWYGGFWPALLSTVLGIVAFNYFFTDPPFTLGISRPGVAIQLLVFATVALFISGLMHAHKRARRETADALQRAQRDPGTGLPNRALLEDRLERAIAAARRDDQKRFALILVNVDGLELVNNAYGYSFGGAVLRAVSERMRSTLRDSDTIARLEGYDFAILAPEVQQADDAVTVAQKLMAALREPVALDGRSVTVAANLGIALFPEHGDDSTALVDKADEAMYAAKRSGAGYSFSGP